MGLDDLRPFNFRQKGEIPIYGSPDTLATIKRCFPYVFDGVARSRAEPQRCLPSLTADVLSSVSSSCRSLCHGLATTYGFRFGDSAYLTDHSAIPAESMARLQGLDVLFLDALRYNPHPTHQTVEQSIRTVEQLRPRRAFFTHISHDLLHATVETRLPENVHLAYDGLDIPIGKAARP